jgi:hypothetical protein
VNTNMLIALALGAWALLRGKKAEAAPALPAASPAPAPRPAAAKPASKVVTVPEVVVTAKPPAPIPLSVTQPVSANAVPWPAVEQAILAKPGNASPAATSRNATPEFYIKKSTGSNPQDEASAVIVRERNPGDSSYWTPVTKVTPAEAERAKAILAINWTKGGVTFDGPRTFAGRRMFKNVETGGRKSVTVWKPKPPFGNEPQYAVKPAAKSASPTPASGKAVPTLRQGSSGNDVAYLQKLLGIAPQDGKFGPNTLKAVVAFQKSKGLTPDGVVGRNTWTALGAFN